MLGIHRNTLQRKREHYKMEPAKVRRKPPRSAEAARTKLRAKAK
jgi:hypothetical protein